MAFLLSAAKGKLGQVVDAVQAAAASPERASNTEALVARIACGDRDKHKEVQSIALRHVALIAPKVFGVPRAFCEDARDLYATFEAALSSAIEAPSRGSVAPLFEVLMAGVAAKHEHVRKEYDFVVTAASSATRAAVVDTHVALVLRVLLTASSSRIERIIDKGDGDAVVNAFNISKADAPAVAGLMRQAAPASRLVSLVAGLVGLMCDRVELQDLWLSAVDGANSAALQQDQFQRWVAKFQASPDDAARAEMYWARAMDDLGRPFTKAAFMKYLTDADFNSVIDSTRVERVYHDMTHPWQHYYINSSHNTYLSGDQLTSDSKPECYTKALVDGCRCVELDCWDGKDGRPIIYHGYTRTSKILFEDVIKAIEKDAFTTSQYPVILSLEVHTSIEQQETMAKIMRDVFGPKLALPTWQPGEPFEITPEAFKNKIIVKGKRISNAAEGSGDDDDDEPEEMQKAKAKAEAKGKHVETQIAPGLSNVIIMESKHMKPFPEVLGLTMMGYEVVSLTESKSEGFAKKNLEQFMEHNSRRFTRVYPAGHRFDSSNYNPQPHWNAGAQVVALNWQTSESYELRLNKGKFIENGNSGYLLKPAYMLSGASSFSPVVVTVEPLSALGLPKPRGDYTGEIIDPYVKIFLEGPSVDPDNVFVTHDVDDNGFRPAWRSATAEFNALVPMARLRVAHPEATMLVVQVWDKDIATSDLLCEAFVPVHMIRPGVRAIPMWNAASYPLCGTAVIARVGVVFL